MRTNEIICGDSLEVMRGWEDNYVNCIITSPPYWGLRDYKTEPQIWGGRKDCRHEWGNEQILKYSGGTGKTDVGYYATDKTHWSSSQGQFCQLCGAWRGELGLEPTPELYIEHLMMVFDECQRVLRKDGVMFVNIGDTYSGAPVSGKQGGFQGDLTRDNPAISSVKKPRIDIPAKCMCAIPERFVLAMMAHGWIRRCTIIWAKGLSFCPTYSGSCMPDSAKDRPNKNGFEHLYMFTKSSITQFWTHKKTTACVGKQPLGVKGTEGVDWEWIEHSACKGEGCDKKRCVNGKVKSSLWEGHDYWYEQQYEGQSPDSHARYSAGCEFPPPAKSDSKEIQRPGYENWRETTPKHILDLGRTIRNVWAINPQAYSDAHFATFPEKLVEPMVKMGCPEFVCKKCGKARSKIYECKGGPPKGSHCGCNAGFRPGVMLDPFVVRARPVRSLPSLEGTTLESTCRKAM